MAGFFASIPITTARAELRLTVTSFILPWPNLRLRVNRCESSLAFLFLQISNWLHPLGSIGGASPATFTNQWVFMSAVYTPAAGGTALIYVGTTNQTAVLGATMTGIGAITNAVKTWLSTSNLVEIGNRISGTGNRALMGSIDDVRLYGSALTQAQLQAIQSVFNAPTITAQPTPVVVFPGQTTPDLQSVTPLVFRPAIFSTSGCGNGTNLHRQRANYISGSTSNALTITGVSSADLANDYQVIITNSVGAVTSSPVSLTLTSTNGAYESAVVSNNPFAFYTFSETGDPTIGNVTAYDSIGTFNGAYGTGNDPTGSGAQNGANGIAGPQAAADGLIGFPDTNTALFTTFQDFPVDSYVTVPPLNLNNGAGANVLTIAAWIKPLGPQAHAVGIVFSRSGTTTAGLCYNATNTADGNLKLGYTWNNETATFTFDSGLEPTPGIWSLVSLVITPTNSTIYLVNANGLQFSTQVHSNVVQRFEGPTLIGNDINDTGGKRNFEGSIDEVAFFNQALTVTNIINLYAAASGTVYAPQPPAISTEPTWPAQIYVGQTASATVSSVGGNTFQWKAGTGGVYTNLTDGTNITGSTTATLTINSVQLTNALDYIVVIANSFGSVTSTPPATLTVTPAGPASSFTLDFGGTPVAEVGGSDWNTVNSWNPDGQPASVSAFSNPGSTYTAVVGSRLRTPVLANTVFPGTGTTLVLSGDGVYEDNTVTNLSELRIKHTGFNPATNTYGHLVLNGGEIFNGDTGLIILRGWLDVQSSSVLYNDVAENRSYQIDSWLTGSGNIFYHDATNGIADLNVTGTSNTFNGQWIIDQGGLLGSGLHSLGTNNIILGANGLVASFETLYDINNPNGSLVLNSNSIVYLHQNDRFASVIINGTPLVDGIYSFTTLNSTYPTNFPATWTPQIGSTIGTGSGQITVGNVVVKPTPHFASISVSGTTLSLSASNGAANGVWTLLQSTNVAVPLSLWQTNTTGNFDSSGNVSISIPNAVTNLQEFYILLQ